MHSIHKFIRDLRSRDGAIWLNGQNIKLSLPVSSQDHLIDAFIAAHKNEIVALLAENNIVSKEEFQRRLILRDRSIRHYPLSSAIEGIWFIERFEHGTSAYNVPLLFEVSSAGDVDGIKFAIGQLVARHEILRTTIQVDADGKGFQVVGDSPLSLEEELIMDKKNLERSVAKDIDRPFDLRTEYPLRVKFFRMPSGGNGNERIFLLINFHHIATDGWSGKIFENELGVYFDAYRNGNVQASLPPLEIQYKEYSLWQRNNLSGVALEEQQEYWKKSLEGYEALDLPTDFPRRSKADYRGSRQVFSFDRNISDKIRQLARLHAITSQSVFLASLSILLGKYSGQHDIVVRSPIANRHHRQTEGLLGCFVNTLVNRTKLTEGQSFAELLRQVHQSQISAQRFQDLPFEKLVSELSDKRDASAPPMFPVLLAVQGMGEWQGGGALKNVLKPFHLSTPHEPARLDLAIYVDDASELISVSVIYVTGLFNDDTIKQFTVNYQQLLALLIEQPLAPYSKLSLFSTFGDTRISSSWKGAVKNYPHNKTIYELFEEQVRRKPDATAVVFEDQSLTYRELSERSNQLARHLRTQFESKTGRQLSGDSLIGLYADRSIEMIVGILGIMKAGGAYVPIDINYPRGRVNYILEDTRAQFVLTQRTLNWDFATTAICIDLQEEFYRYTDASMPSNAGSATDLAYVIYTSGTTGKPKGVMVEHASLVNLVYAQHTDFGVDQNTRALQFAALVFDASVSEIFTALIFGSSLFVVSNPVRQDASLLVDYLDENKISVATIPPALLSAMPYKNLPDLKVVVVAGERCSQAVIERWSSGRKLINAYGPTENTVCATMHVWLAGNSNSTIGRPIDNTCALVVDKFMNPVPIGGKGELFIGGRSLARGYLNNAPLTRACFIEMDFPSLQQPHYTRWYRTGDQVRWRADGNLEFYGRNDSQVKIRGHRIELQEIEYALSNIKGIKQCCVVARDRNANDGAVKYLAAYYTLDESSDKVAQSGTFDHLSQILPGYMLKGTAGDTSLSKESILQQLKHDLPEYMIPEALIHVPSIPLTINGKIDKAALPEPELSTTLDFVPPTTEREIMLCTIWREILGLKRVGLTDDFFKVGGNSILAIQASHRMSKALGCDISVADIFKFKTIAGLEKLSLTDPSNANGTGEHWELAL